MTLASTSYVQSVISRLQESGLLGPERKSNQKNYVFDCPFTAKHGGKKVQRTPSFGIHKTSGMWNCYSCGSRGRDIRGLFKRLTGQEDPKSEAEVLASKDNLDSLRDTILYAGEKRNQEPYAQAMPSEILPIREHREAMEYLTKRSIPEWIWDRCELAYTARHRRILIPIKMYGTLIGYSSRAIDKGVEPKYYRPIENARSALYDPLGILETGGPIVFLVEGEFDALACLRERIPVLCTFHCALSDEALRHLAKFGTVVFMYDPDVAGIEGTNKAVRRNWRFMKYRKIRLPNGMDPGSMPVGYRNTIYSLLGSSEPPNNNSALRRRLNGISEVPALRGSTSIRGLEVEDL